MSKFILTFLTVICGLFCLRNQNNINSKNLPVVVINQTKNQAEQFKYFDYFGTSQLMPFPKSDTLYIKNSHPIVTYLTNSADFSDLRYYTLSSSDTIYIKIERGKEVLMSHNKVLECKINLMSMLLFNVGSMNYSRNMDFKTCLKAIDNFYLNKKQIIERNKNNCDKNTIKEANEMVRYDKLASLFALYTHFNKKSELITSSLTIPDSAAWTDLTFRNMVANCNRYVNNVYHINSPTAFIHYIKDKYPPSMKENAIFYYLNAYKPVDKNKLDTLNALVTAFAKYAVNQEFVNTLKINLEKYTNNFKAKDSKAVELLSTKNNNSISLDQLLAQNAGKLIFIDFWATWCAPCLAEMPGSSALAKAYRIKNAPIAFLYLSKDENMTTWKNKSNELQLSADQSFIVLNNDAFLQFARKYNIITIPRYMILGKKGEMIDPDALRPGDPKLRALLDRLLKKDMSRSGT